MGDGPDSETLDALPEVTIAVSGGPIARPRGAVVLVLPASRTLVSKNASLPGMEG